MDNSLLGAILALVLILAVAVACGLVGRALCRRKGRSSVAGFLLGFFLGVIGVLIAALLTSSTDMKSSDTPSRSVRPPLPRLPGWAWPMTIGAVGYLVLLVFRPAAIGLADAEWLPSSGRTMVRPILLVAISSIVGVSARGALRGRPLVAATGLGALMALCGHGLILLGDHIRTLSCFPIFHPECNSIDVFPRTGSTVVLPAILDLAVIGASLAMIAQRDIRVTASRCLRLAWIPAVLLLVLATVVASPTPRWGLLAVVTPGALVAIGALVRRTAKAMAIAAGWAAAILLLPMIDSIVGQLRAIGGSRSEQSLASQVYSLRPASAFVAAVIILAAALAMLVRSETRSAVTTSHSPTASGGEALQPS